MAGDEGEPEVQVHWLENVMAKQFIVILRFIHDVRITHNSQLKCEILA